MTDSNWLTNDRNVATDPNIRYQLDSAGLQIPLEWIGVSLVGDFAPRISGERQVIQPKPVQPKIKNTRTFGKNKPNGVQQTVDGIPIRKIYITNISIEVTQCEIETIFCQFGVVKHVYMGVNKNNSTKQFAFITYADPKVAAHVLSIKRMQDFRGRLLYITAADSWHQPKEGPDGRIIWDSRFQPKKEEESEEDDEQAIASQLKTMLFQEEGLNTLNDDCLLHIFSFLSLKEIAGVERVCKRWQGLSYRLWRCLHKLSYSQPSFPKMEPNTKTLVHYLHRCGPVLTELDLTTPLHHFNESTLAHVAKYCCNLEVLKVCKLDVGKRSLAHLGRSCPKLRKLAMDECRNFNDSDLMALLPKCPELRDLDLSNTSCVTGKCLLNVQGALTSLSLSHCSAVESWHLVAGLEQMKHSLESLTLNACGNLTSGEVQKIVTAVPNLTSLSLCHILPHFEDTKLLLPVSRLSQLSSLSLVQTTSLKDCVLAAIVEGCQALTAFDISCSGNGSIGNLTDKGLAALSCLKHLKDLNVSYLEAINSASLKTISRISKLKRLVCRGCPDASDEGCIQVVTMCNELELFDLSGCEKVTDETVSAALTSVKMRTNNIPLRIVVGGTGVEEPIDGGSQLSLDMADYSEEHLRPDFIDDLFFLHADSDDEEDLEELCERMGCDYDFDFDDLYDPTLMPSDFDDDTPKYGAYDESYDVCTILHCVGNGENGGDDEEDDVGEWESWD